MRFVDSLNSIQNSLTHTKFETGVVIQNKAVNRSDKSRLTRHKKSKTCKGKKEKEKTTLRTDIL